MLSGLYSKDADGHLIQTGFSTISSKGGGALVGGRHQLSDRCAQPPSHPQPCTEPAWASAQLLL